MMIAGIVVYTCARNVVHEASFISHSQEILVEIYERQTSNLREGVLVRSA